MNQEHFEQHAAAIDQAIEQGTVHLKASSADKPLEQYVDDLDGMLAAALRVIVQGDEVDAVAYILDYATLILNQKIRPAVCRQVDAAS